LPKNRNRFRPGEDNTPGFKITPLENHLYAFLKAVERMESDARFASIKSFCLSLHHQPSEENFETLCRSIRHSSLTSLSLNFNHIMAWSPDYIYRLREAIYESDIQHARFKPVAHVLTNCLINIMLN